MAYKIKTSCIGCSVCKIICPVDAIIGAPKKIHQVVSDLCIDCGACGRACPHEAVLDPKGKLCQRLRVKKTWPKPVFDLEDCVACRICIEACPVGCLALTETSGTRDTIRKPVLKKERACIACEICAEDCPVDAIRMVKPKI